MPFTTWSRASKYSGQYYECSTIVNYNSAVVVTREMPIYIPTIESKYASILRLYSHNMQS